MFQHNIDPVLFEIVGLQIRYYGLVYVLGFIFIYFYLRYLYKKKQTDFKDADSVDLYVLYLVIGLLIGSRLFIFLFYEPAQFLTNPLVFFRIDQGGMSYHGGIAGAVVATYLFARRKKISFEKLADIVIVPSFFFLFLGRIANFINAELPGTLTQAAWCVEYPNHPHIDGCRHPYQFYEAFKNLGLFFVFLFFALKKQFREGFLLWSGIFFYNLTRFFIDFYRDEQTILLGLSMGQLLCIAFMIVSGYFLVKIYKQKNSFMIK